MEWIIAEIRRSPSVPSKMVDIEDAEEIEIDDIEAYELPPSQQYNFSQCSNNVPENRLIIHTIELENFKSYGGRQVLGPFHDRFSCIIGPNGSGKSNIIDSMLFVFGYRAQKIRGANLVSLIHSSPSIPNAQNCSVTINFRLIKHINEDVDEIGIDHHVIEAFTISRTAFASGGSTYKVGKMNVVFSECGFGKFTDVQNKLKSFGVDLVHNRFLILQGEVEQIAAMKPKKEHENGTGLVEYLESLIGTDRYIRPIELAQSRYDQLEDERLEHTNRVRIALSECKAHEESYYRAIDFMMKENLLNSLQKRSFELELNEVNHIFEDNSAALKAAEDELGLIEQKLNQCKMDHDEKKKHAEKANASLANDTKLLASLKVKYTKMDTQDSQKRSEVVQNEKSIEEIDKKVEKDRNELKKLEKKAQEKQKEFEKGNKLNELEEQAKYAAGRLNEMNDKAVSDTREIQQRLEMEHGKMMSHHPAYSAAEQKLEGALNIQRATNDDLESVSQKHEECLRQIDEIGETLRRLEADESMKKTEYNEIVQKLRHLNEQITLKRKLYKTKRDEFETVSEELNIQKRWKDANMSRNAVLGFLRDQEGKGELTGLRGRLGDLAYVDPKYDVAVSTAGGGYLDYIVTNTINQQFSSDGFRI
ncbi:hypothetical protein ACOME3_003225 [Neoechinorhynchus agilis]